MNLLSKGKNDMSKADKIMEEAFGGEFEDVRTAKKRKKVKNSIDTEEKDGIITSNDEGLEIIHGKGKFVGWDLEKKRKVWRFDPDKNVADWTAWDLFEYAHQLYVKKYNKNWNLLRGGNSMVILKIFEKIESKLGSNNYLLMKDYVVFFFEKYLDKYARMKGNNLSIFDHMNRSEAIDAFCLSYNMAKNQEEYEKLKKKGKSGSITNSDLEKSYALSLGTLLSNYGIIIAANWLVMKKRLKKKETSRAIFETCKVMYEKGTFDSVVRSTEHYSPYPDWLMFNNPSIITDKIDKNVKINVEFSKNEENKLDFLKENC